MTKADKGITLVFMNHNDYRQKTINFFNKNNITRLSSDPTNKFHKKLNQVIKKCTTLLSEAANKSIKPTSPQAPQFTVLPKIHKKHTSIRPLINYTSLTTVATSMTHSSFSMELTGKPSLSRIT